MQHDEEIKLFNEYEEGGIKEESEREGWREGRMEGCRERGKEGEDGEVRRRE